MSKQIKIVVPTIFLTQNSFIQKIFGPNKVLKKFFIQNCFALDNVLVKNNFEYNIFWINKIKKKIRVKKTGHKMSGHKV